MRFSADEQKVPAWMTYLSDCHSEGNLLKFSSGDNKKMQLNEVQCSRVKWSFLDDKGRNCHSGGNLLEASSTDKKKNCYSMKFSAHE